MISTSEWSNYNSFGTKTGFIPTTEKAQIEPPAGGANNFGFSVALSDDEQLLFVGAYASSKVFIFSYNGTSYTYTTTIIPSVGTAYYGYSVAVSDDGSTMFVGSFNIKRVFVYKYNGTSYVEEQILTPSGTGTNFGRFLATDSTGSRVLVAATSGIGEAYLYKYDGASYVEEKKFTPSTATTNLYGAGVDISKDGLNVVISVNGDDTSPSWGGRVYTYQFNGTTWIEKTIIRFIDNADSVSISRNGMRLLIGRSQNSYNPVICHYEGGDFVQKPLLPIPNSPNTLGAVVKLNDSGTKAVITERNGNKFHIYTTTDGVTWSIVNTIDGPTAVGGIAINGDLSKVWVGYDGIRKVYLYE